VWGQRRLNINNFPPKNLGEAQAGKPLSGIAAPAGGN